MELLKGKFCWNTKCPNASSSTSAWKQGWRLNSGRRVADLCEHCGSIFEQSRFCEVFHREESGWRECNSCRKRLHCGCVVSTLNYVLADIGGVDCVACVRQEETCNKLNLLTNPSSDSTSTRGFLLSEHSSGEEADRKRKVEETLREAKRIKNSSTQSPGRIAPTDTAPTTSSTPPAVPSTEVTPETEKPQTEFWTPPASVPVLQDGTEKEKPANELWTVVPLFEKMLTASDAGRIGRLVLPKASAEAFFPPISVPEGIPIKMPDMNGKEWQFQFRFWPNNSSRMYVLEGITPCVKAMQLVAGDVVTFSRREPGGQIVMGYRRNSSLQRPKAGKESGNSSITKNGRKSDDNLKAVDTSPPSGTYVTTRTTWEEAQELLTPPPGVTPSIMTIDGHRFEEYEEPPILAKRVQYSAVYGNSCASPLPG